MRLTRHIALIILITLGLFSAMFYTSCKTDNCANTTCMHEPNPAKPSRCKAGMGICYCDGPKSGLGGNNCEIVYRDEYVGKPYTGSAIYTSSVEIDTVMAGDTVFVSFADSNNTLAFNATGYDSIYNKCKLLWNRPGKQSVFAEIVLENFSSAGATFSFPATSIDTFTYSGSGSVSGSSASLNLIESHPHSPSVIITLSNFSKR